MAFKYETETKKHYQDEAVAEKYNRAYTSDGGLRGFRFRYIARKEREAIDKALSSINCQRVLDLPTGTGKLASLFAEKNYDVVAADVSSNMLDIAKKTYESLGYENVEYIVGDAESISNEIKGEIDAVVCLRLMHRVPSDVRKRILKELASVSSYLVVSYGIEKFIHKIRRPIRSIIFGGGNEKLCYAKEREIAAEISEYCDIIREIDVASLVSQERIYVLKSKGNR